MNHFTLGAWLILYYQEKHCFTTESTMEAYINAV